MTSPGRARPGRGPVRTGRPATAAPRSRHACDCPHGRRDREKVRTRGATVVSASVRRGHRKPRRFDRCRRTGADPFPAKQWREAIVSVENGNRLRFEKIQKIQKAVGSRLFADRPARPAGRPDPDPRGSVFFFVVVIVNNKTVTIIIITNIINFIMVGIIIITINYFLLSLLLLLLPF